MPKHDAMTFQEAIRLNCDISDAKDSGVFSMCLLFLRLRNLFKWEHGFEPWSEPDPPVLLDWIEKKEQYWETILEHEFHHVPINGKSYDPFDLETINKELETDKLYYGAGYGRSLKAVFFLAEKISSKRINGHETLILGKELVRELASPFAMLQDSTICFRRESFRFFLWDRIVEGKMSGKAALLFALNEYNLLNAGGKVDLDRLKGKLDLIADEEMLPIIHHEVGELTETVFDRDIYQDLIYRYSGELIELYIRALKDVLADTTPTGMLSYIVTSSAAPAVGFYAAFLDGMRAELSKSMSISCSEFFLHREWQKLDKARQKLYEKMRHQAQLIQDLYLQSKVNDYKDFPSQFSDHILKPAGIIS